jgi:hypothetical protein
MEEQHSPKTSQHTYRIQCDKKEDHHLDLSRYFENIIWAAFPVCPWAIPTLVKIQQKQWPL